MIIENWQLNIFFKHYDNQGPFYSKMIQKKSRYCKDPNNRGPDIRWFAVYKKKLMLSSYHDKQNKPNNKTKTELSL